MKFNVCVLPSSIHTQCFAEIADSVAWALKELGHEVTQTNRGEAGARNVIFGVRPDGTLLPPDSIIYNGEQVGQSGMWPACARQYKGFTVWDYSAANAERYSQWGLPAPSVVRPGYAPVLDGRIQLRVKTHDVVFFGSSNERREKLLREFEEAGMSVLRVPFGIYGADRDTYLGRARFCINVHYYEAGIFEAIRCSYLAQNGIPVVSEESVAGENKQWGIVGLPYGQLVAFVKGGLDVGAETAELQQQKARDVSILDDVRQAVEVLEAPIITARSTVALEQGITKEHLTLCMIVKNEAAVIERCLASVKPVLSRWSIVDTGSTDGTQEIIRKFMADVPGKLHECSWKEYDGSRTEALELARAECDGEGWLMLIDADETAEFEGELVLPDGYDCYDGWIKRPGASNPWGRSTFARASKRWHYVLPRHEGLYCLDAALPTASEPLRGMLITSSFEGARAKEDGYARFMRDGEVLEAWISKNPAHFALSRAVYYAGKSYHTAASSKHPFDRRVMQKAIALYLRRAEMAGYPQEAFAACYQAAQCMILCAYPWERAQQIYLKAYALRASRAEPIFNIARYYREQGDAERAAGREASGMYALGVLFARQAVLIGPSSDIFDDVDHTVNDWRMKDELAHCLTYLNGHAEARDLNRFILQYGELTEWDRKRVQENLAMCLRVAPDAGLK